MILGSKVKETSFLRSIAVSIFVCIASVVKADVLPVNAAAFAPNVMELQISDTSIDLRMEIFVGDLGVFEELVPSSWMKSNAKGRAGLEQRINTFAREKLVIKSDGETLMPELLLVEPRRRIDRRSDGDRLRNAASNIVVAEPPSDDRVMYVELKYELPDRASVIELTPPLSKDGRAESTIGFIVFHQGVPVTDFWYLTGTERLVLNWDDPWYSAFENRTLKRHHSSSALTFLYVDPREVRHETLIRIRDLAAWAELDLPTDLRLTQPDKARISRTVEDFFLGFEPISINGRDRAPVEARTQYLEVTPAGLETVEEERPLNANTALVGVILSYPVEQTPDRVEVSWTLFNERLPQVSATLIDESGPIADILTTERTKLIWQNKLLSSYDPIVVAVNEPAPRSINVSFLSLCMIAGAVFALWLAFKSSRKMRWASLSAAMILSASAFTLRSEDGIALKIPLVAIADQQAAELVLSALLKEIGDAYYEVDEYRRRSALEELILQDEMSDVASEIDRGLAIRVPGGGVAKTDTISSLSISEFRPYASNAGFSAVAEWEVQANASHWGHDHFRAVRFRALADVVFQAGAWRLSGLTVIEANRVGAS